MCVCDDDDDDAYTQYRESTASQSQQFPRPKSRLAPSFGTLTHPTPPSNHLTTIEQTLQAFLPSPFSSSPRLSDVLSKR